MEWNVYRISMHGKGIVQYNIFDHGRFRESCRKTAVQFYDDKETFKKDIESHLLYYFWSKCEYELYIAASLETDTVARKVDIYRQVMLNWDRFFDYVWENRDLLKEKEKK